MKKVLTKKGFTLIELIVVIGILAVLAVVLIPSIMNYVGEARLARNNANARALYSEVAAGVAMGTIKDASGSPVIDGGVSCPYTVDADKGTLLTFGVCTATDGDIDVLFTP